MDKNKAPSNTAPPGQSGFEIPSCSSGSAAVTGGTVKVLDFGLAKAWTEEKTPASLSVSPTLTQQKTKAGVILGTAAYMAPEQAKGLAVDKRADIWAFGSCSTRC